MGIEIGHNLKSARNAAGLTQEELAQQCGVATITIRQYESGKREPKYDTLERLADALDVPLEVLLGIGDSISSVDNVQAQATKNYAKNRFTEATAWKARLDEIGEDMEKLNDEGQLEAVKRVKELTEIAKYQRPRQPSPLSAGITVYGDGPAGSFPPLPQDAPQLPPASAESTDTTQPTDAPETPPEGK